MNTEHTPGPWHVDYAQGIMTQDGDAIAYCCEDCSAIPSPNARLIAAAPDLLEALKIIASGGADQFAWSMTKAELLAREAIAKAEGKA